MTRDGAGFKEDVLSQVFLFGANAPSLRGSRTSSRRSCISMAATVNIGHTIDEILDEIREQIQVLLPR